MTEKISAIVEGLRNRGAQDELCEDAADLIQGAFMRKEPFTLRMAAHELIGERATNALLEKHSPQWLAYVLITYVEANDLHTPTATLLREWYDRITP